MKIVQSVVFCIIILFSHAYCNESQTAEDSLDISPAEATLEYAALINEANAVGSNYYLEHSSENRLLKSKSIRRDQLASIPNLLLQTNNREANEKQAEENQNFTAKIKGTIISVFLSILLI